MADINTVLYGGKDELTMAQYEALETVAENTDFDLIDYPHDGITNIQMTFALTCQRLFPVGTTMTCIDDGTYSKGHIYQIQVDAGVKSWKDISLESGTIVNVNNVKVNNLNFTSDPQTQIDNILNNNNKISGTNGGFAGGNGSSSSSGGAVGAFTTVVNGGAVGYGAVCANGFAGGYYAKCLSGPGASGHVIDAVQLGTGSNNKEKSLQVYDDNIYDSVNHELTISKIKIGENEMQVIVRDADPTTSTVGVVNQVYLNIKTLTLFKCTAVSESAYTWEIVATISVDTEMSDKSTNPVQNKIITNALKDKLNILGLGEINRVYVRKTENLDSSLPFTYTAEADSIAHRNASGQTQVEAPSQEKDATNKKYVDEKLALKQDKLTAGSRIVIEDNNTIKSVTNYIDLTGEDGSLDDAQMVMLQGDDMVVLRRSGVLYRLNSKPINGSGDYVFYSDYYSTGEIPGLTPYMIILKQDKTWKWQSLDKNSQGAVMYVAQQLSQEQKNQACKNIGVNQTFEDSDGVAIIRNGNIVMQSKTFTMQGNSEKVFSFPVSYDADKKPMCWCNSSADGISSNNSSAVTSCDSNSMVVRICGVESTVTFFAQGWVTKK